MYLIYTVFYIVVGWLITACVPDCYQTGELSRVTPNKNFYTRIGSVGLDSLIIAGIDPELEYFGPEMFGVPNLIDSLRSSRTAVSLPLTIEAENLLDPLIVIVRSRSDTVMLFLATQVEQFNTQQEIPLEQIADYLSAGLYDIYLFNDQKIVAKDRFVLLR